MSNWLRLLVVGFVWWVGAVMLTYAFHDAGTIEWSRTYFGLMAFGAALGIYHESGRKP